MTMRTASSLRSPCELLRKVNDLCQEDDPKDNEIRKLLAECEKKIKVIARGVPREKRKNWTWEYNPGWKDELDRRLKDDYLQEGSLGSVGKLDDVDKL